MVSHMIKGRCPIPNEIEKYLLEKHQITKLWLDYGLTKYYEPYNPMDSIISKNTSIYGIEEIDTNGKQLLDFGELQTVIFNLKKEIEILKKRVFVLENSTG
jgi:hypothetical protein